MKTIITSANADEDTSHNFSAEASTLGLPPGHVPRFLETTLGNKEMFVLTNMTDELFTYKQRLGCITLTIFND